MTWTDLLIRYRARLVGSAPTMQVAQQFATFFFHKGRQKGLFKKKGKKGAGNKCHSLYSHGPPPWRFWGWAGSTGDNTRRRQAPTRPRRRPFLLPRPPPPQQARPPPPPRAGRRRSGTLPLPPPLLLPARRRPRPPRGYRSPETEPSPISHPSLDCVPWRYFLPERALEPPPRLLSTRRRRCLSSSDRRAAGARHCLPFSSSVFILLFQIPINPSILLSS